MTLRNLDVFEYLQNALIEWKPKTTDNSQQGVGFNTGNVVNIAVGGLPPHQEFDYVFFTPAATNFMRMTTGGGKVGRTTETYQIDLYCRRSGLGNAMKRETLKAMGETMDFITNLFSQQGYMVTTVTPDLNFGGNDTIRQIVNITRTYII